MPVNRDGRSGWAQSRPWEGPLGETLGRGLVPALGMALVLALVPAPRHWPSSWRVVPGHRPGASSLAIVLAPRPWPSSWPVGRSFIWSACVRAVWGRVAQLAGERVVRDLRRDLFASVIAQDMGFFDRNRTGELINRLSADTTLIGKSITNNLMDGSRSILQAIVGVCDASSRALAPPHHSLTSVLGARWTLVRGWGQVSR